LLNKEIKVKGCFIPTTPNIYKPVLHYLRDEGIYCKENTIARARGVSKAKATSSITTNTIQASRINHSNVNVNIKSKTTTPATAVEVKAYA
jgi:hypothetical protein